MCTFMFALVILIIKGKGTNPAGENDAIGAFAVAVGLLAIIMLDGRVGACFNPAVGITQTLYQVSQWPDGDGSSQSRDALTRYLWAYTVGPAAGGALAGLVFLYHKNAVSKLKGYARY